DGEQGVVGDVEPQKHGEMVDQVAAHPGGVPYQIHPVLGEVVTITDARQHQQLRAVDGAPTQHYLTTCAGDAARTAVLEFHADRPVSVEHHLRHGRFGEHRQVLPLER